MEHSFAAKNNSQSKNRSPVRRQWIGQSDAVRSVLRPKLRIGASNDVYEQQADRIADQVMTMSEIQPALISDSTATNNDFFPDIDIVRRSCAACAKSLDEEWLQSKATGSGKQELSPAIVNGIQSLQGGGQPLSHTERGFFEPRFAADFSRVRVHNDAHAHLLAQSLNARAFTIGNNVVFGSGEYASHCASGKKLFAHELTHVLQQDDSAIRRYTTDEIESCPCLEWSLLRMFLYGRTMAAGGALTGRTYAMSFMDHFLNRSGNDRYVPFSELNADSGGQSARLTVDGQIRNHFIRAARNLPCNDTDTTSTSKNTPGHFDHGTDLFYAMGAFGLRANASGMIAKQCDGDGNCDNISADYEIQYRVNDLYDWKVDPGGCTPATGESGCTANTKTVTLPVLGLICDECLNRLVIHGWAEEFMVKIRGLGEFEIDSPCNVATPSYSDRDFSDNARNDP